MCSLMQATTPKTLRAATPPAAWPWQVMLQQTDNEQAVIRLYVAKCEKLKTLFRVTPLRRTKRRALKDRAISLITFEIYEEILRSLGIASVMIPSSFCEKIVLWKFVDHPHFLHFIKTAPPPPPCFSFSLSSPWILGTDIVLALKQINNTYRNTFKSLDETKSTPFT